MASPSSPLFDLAPDGVYRPTGHPAAGELLPHHFTLTQHGITPGGLFLWHFSLRSPSLAVSQHPALWSSDFPRISRSAIASFLKFTSLE